MPAAGDGRSPAGSALDASIGRLTAPISGVLLVLLLALSLVSFGAPPAGDQLDPSWTGALGSAFERGLQAGVDYVFTFGPLGYLSHPASAYDPELFSAYLASQIVLALAVAGLLIAVAWRVEPPERVIYLLLVFLVIPRPTMPLVVTAGTLWALQLPRGRERSKLVVGLLLALVFFLAATALTKFDMFVFAGAAVATLSVGRVDSLGKAWRWPAVYVSCLVGLWVACGQSVTNLPLFFLRSLDLAAGYSEAMAAGFDATEIIVALVVCALITAQLGLVFRARREWRTTVAALLVLFGLFMSWKTGFTRHDAHALEFFSYGLIVPFLLPLRSRQEAAPDAVVRTLRFVASGLCLWGIVLASPPGHLVSPTKALSQLGSRLRAHVVAFTDLSVVRDQRELSRRVLAEQHDLPRIRSVVGDHSVDIFNYSQGLLFLNELEWTPRPVFQSYAAFTPKLIRLNGDFMRGESAPHYVVFQLQTIDGQHAWTNDAEALQAVLSDYRPVLAEKGYLLLERKMTGTSAAPARTPLRIERVGFLDWLETADLSAQTALLTVKMEMTFLGRLLATVYKVPPIFLEVETKTGWKRKFKFVPSMAETGFVINPVIRSHQDLVEWFVGGYVPSLARLRFGCESPWADRIYRDEIVLALEAVEISPPELGDGVRRELRRKLGGVGLFFSSAADGAFLPGTARDLAVGDFNGDGGDDLARIDDNRAISYTVDGESWNLIPGGLDQITTGDFDGDGKDDLAGATGGGESYITLDRATWSRIPGSWSDLLGVDLDGDGRDDLAALSASGEVSVQMESGQWERCGRIARELVAGDFNGDGAADLLTLGNDDRIQWSADLANWNALSGRFAQVIAGDFDGDGDDDLAGLTAEGEVRLTTDLHSWKRIGRGFSEIAGGDFDGDGDDDLAGLAAVSGRVRVTTDMVSWKRSVGPRALLVCGDFNDDGRDDLAGLN